MILKPCFLWLVLKSGESQKLKRFYESLVVGHSTNSLEKLAKLPTWTRGQATL